MFSTYIDGAAQQGASLQRFANYPVEISWSSAELIHLRHTTSEVLKPFSGAPSRQSLIGAIQPDSTSRTHFTLIAVHNSSLDYGLLLNAKRCSGQTPT